ncbi:hypothetical protein FSP39_006138 [Pinctada imbricata]|uniref:Lipoma HMGIC fusion partner-like protein n=1 Tax=Pinctada imbricata TaxID=66713 RepID=A0AA88XZH2_PINIB|nr:hypothetical protein FSP39_006138 [Pinctada imbricata]
MPYWLRGSLPDLQDAATYFGVFRRCNFPYESEGKILLREECGRYSSFLDIPSLWWQIGTLTIGVGCCLAVLIAITAVLAICIQDIVSPKIAKVAGVLQLCAALLIGGGVAIYPNGWNSQEVQQACGSTSGPYILGECSLYWAFYVTGSCAGTILIMSFLACHAARRKNGRNNPTDV